MKSLDRSKEGEIRCTDEGKKVEVQISACFLLKRLDTTVLDPEK
jgi:hypothetical protein